MSASVQWVAIRTIETPRSATARTSSMVATPGSMSAATFERVASLTAARISTSSSTALKP
jgi:hypothetical protein